MMYSTICLIAAVLALPLYAAEPASSFPLWNGKESVADYARKVNLPPTRSFDLGGGVTLDLVLIPAGQFMMGSPEPPKPAISWRSAAVMGTCGLILAVALLCVLLVNCSKVGKFAFSLRWLLLFTASCGLCVGGAVRFNLAKKQESRYAVAMSLYEKLPADEKPAHLETIAAPFYMGKYAVTQAQYEIFAGNNPSTTKGPQLPVDRANGPNTTDYCAVLSYRLEGLLDDEQKIQIPTEAQWEYACRAGTTTTFNTGDTISTDEANFDGASTSELVRGSSVCRGELMPVGSFKPNAFGLYDMHGNAKQTCINQLWPKAHEKFVHRGGGFGSNASECRSAYHHIVRDGEYPYGTGFRVILNVPPVSPH
ncbi:MAG TPA: formylglycine-generating enzyme family protein [Planctomycetota bacterium]|nr:formylglycine-generating enzyme family protein [Planctomycetota bacterium]